MSRLGYPRRSRRTSWATGAVVVAAGACLTACVQVPDAGPVVQAREPVQTAPIDNPYNNPPPPTSGASPSRIVTGFLDAMTATPLQTRVARKYLTSAGQSVWEPEQGVVAYSGLRLPHGTTTVRTRLRGADRIGPAGQWLGPVSRAASRLTFPMRKENGEWRIASAPNALLVPRTFYEQSFQDASLYFFDPTGRILVPEVVHMPQGQQLITALVHALLLGPRPSLTGVVRTFVPPGLDVDPLVVRNGTAGVILSGQDPGLLSPTTTRLMLSQLAWTLRQDPSVSTFTLTIAGRTITDSTGASKFSVNGSAFNDYDPAAARASSQVYALRRGRLVSGPVTKLTSVNGPFGTKRTGIGPFAVSLDSTQLAGVTTTSLLVGGIVLGSSEPETVVDGPGLLRPSWDFAHRLWEIRNDPEQGAAVLYVVKGNQHTLRVRGITGEDVRRFIVSRDGSRIIAVLRGAERDHIVASRIRYDASGRAIGASRAKPIQWVSSGTTRIRDIGWTSPTTIAVLDQLSVSQAEVRILNVDGSTRADQASPTLISGRVRALVGSPDQPPFAVLPTGLQALSQGESQIAPNRQIPTEDLHHLTYAG